MAEQRAFVDSRRFKMMRVVIGAANPLVKAVLGSRFAGPMGKSLALLRFTGRTSGKTYTTPVGYVRDGDRVVVVTSPTYRWWRNVQDGADVDVRLAGEWFAGRARVLPTDDPGFDDAVALQVRARGPRLLRGFGVEVSDDGRITDAAKADMSGRALVVLIRLGSGAPA